MHPDDPNREPPLDRGGSGPPYRITTVEPIERLSRSQREARIRDAGYNLFGLSACDVTIDLLTDSGTGAMSTNQWAGLMQGDESYAGSRSFQSLQAAVRTVLGFEHVIPCHQGRGTENVLASTLLEPEDIVLGNAPFDTTRAHIEHRGARVIDCTVAEAGEPTKLAPFKGNVDLKALERALDVHGEEVAFVLVTVTCNAVGGQPVSLHNLHGVAKRARQAEVPVFLDAARFAENAKFIQMREAGQGLRPIQAIVREMMSLANAVLVSAKKNGLVNIGGFIATRDEALYRALVPSTILYEGFPTYGGLAGRDLEAMARGLEEAVDDAFLTHRVGQIAGLHERLEAHGIPVLSPPGGHAVYVDALRFLSHLERDRFPAHTLAVELYVEGGIRGVGVGGVMAGRDPDTGEHRWPENEYLRLAVPARTYTMGHLEEVAQALARVHARRERIEGYVFEDEAPVLRHFTSTFRPA